MHDWTMKVSSSDTVRAVDAHETQCRAYECLATIIQAGGALTQPSETIESVSANGAYS